MGFEKEGTKDWDALGICDGNGGDVCGDCIGDLALREFISANATKTSCTYCGQHRDSPFASPLSVVVEHMAGFINEEFKHDDLRLTRQAPTGMASLTSFTSEFIGFEPNEIRT